MKSKAEGYASPLRSWRERCQRIDWGCRRSARHGRTKLGTVGQRFGWGNEIHRRARPPALFDGGHELIDGLGWNAPGVVVLPHVMRVAVDKNQRTHPLGMGSREVDLGHAWIHARQRRSLESHRVQHSRQVSIGDVAHQGRSWVTLRRAHAPRVEPDGATEGLQPPAKTDKPWIVGYEIDRNRGGHENQFEWPLPAHLVGEAGPIPRAGVTGLRGVGHHLGQSARGRRVAAKEAHWMAGSGAAGLDRRSVHRPAAFWGRRDSSGDHIVEGLYDALVESRKHLLQVTACHDQLAKSGVVCLA